MSIIHHLYKELLVESSSSQTTIKVPAHLVNLIGWEKHHFDDYVGNDLDNWATKQLPKLSTPVDVVVNKDGSMVYNDGHHRVTSAQHLKKDIILDITKNKLDPAKWDEYLGMIRDGLSWVQINPNGDMLRDVDLSKVREFYEKNGFDYVVHRHDSKSMTYFLDFINS